jgi:hypothetical protein
MYVVQAKKIDCKQFDHVDVNVKRERERERERERDI